MLKSFYEDIKKHFEIIAICLILLFVIVFGLVAKLFWGELHRNSAMLGVFTTYFATITMLFTLGNTIYLLHKKRKDKVEIKIFLQYEDDDSIRCQLSQTILRANLTRAELKGYLADCYSGGQFKIPYLGKSEFSKNLIDAQQGKTDTILIKLLSLKDSHNQENPTDINKFRCLDADCQVVDD